MYCRKCGMKNNDGARFCRNCGEALSEAEIPFGGNLNKKENCKVSNKNKWLIVVIAVVLFLAVLVAIGHIFKDKKAKKAYDDSLASGERFLEDMDYENAEDSYLQAISIDPKQTKPYADLADVYMAQNYYQKADEILVQAVEAITEENVDTNSIADLDWEDETISIFWEKAKEIKELSEAQAYYDLLVQYQEKYGEAGSGEVYEGWPYLTGLCFAKLVDFDADGKEELVTAYADGMGDDTNCPEYIIKIWQYKDYSVQKIGETEGYVSDSGETCIYMTSVDKKNFIIAGAFGGGETEYIQGKQGEEFIQIKGLVWQPNDDFSEEFFIDGKEVSEEGYAAEANKWWNDSLVTYGLSTIKEDEEISLEELERTFEELRSRLGMDGSETPDSSGEQKEEVSSEMYQEMYEPLIQDVYDLYGEYNYYWLYDIDKDGINELLLQEGTCEADYIYRIYTILNQECICLGEIDGAWTTFYADENGGTESYIIQSQTHMGECWTTRISIEDKEISTEELTHTISEEGEDDAKWYYENPYSLEYAEVSDLSLLKK